VGAVTDRQEKRRIERQIGGTVRALAVLKNRRYDDAEAHALALQSVSRIAADPLRDEHGGGEFQIMIRRGEKMLLAGEIAIAAPPHSTLR
jgi:hypothetical protein